MGRESFRFVHATSLHLDEPVIGISSLSGNDRHIAEDATLIAWDGIVNVCIKSQVDFLLIAGDTFAAAAESLRARVALEKGFERLVAQRIPVYIVAGAIDPAAAWKRWVHFPPQVTLLADEETEPVTIRRSGQVLATLFVVASPHTDEAKWNGSGPAALGRQHGPYSIGVVPAGTPLKWQNGRPTTPDVPGEPRAAATLVKAAIDGGVNYLALGDGSRQTINIRDGVVHGPGPAQALDHENPGASGCSLVQVSASGPPRIEFIPVGPVRFETISLNLGERADWDELVHRMTAAVKELESYPQEKLWMISWQLRGTARVFDELARPAAQSELWDLVEAELEDPAGFRRLHRLSLHHWAGREEFEDHLLEEFEQVLAEEGMFLVEELRRDAQSLEGLPERFRRQLVDIIEATPRKTLISKARSLALSHLQVAND